MGIFQKKETFDIRCRDRSLKNIIDECYSRKPDWDGDYEDRVIFYVKQGIKYRQLLLELLDEGYAKHKSDPSCDIPDYKTFLSLEQTMIDNQDEYQHKTICVEGYVAYSLWDHKEWNRNNACVFIYPIPCETDAEKHIFYSLADELNATDSIILVSDDLLPTQTGVHIRAYGVPCFYKAWDGGRAGKVHILVQKYEVLS